VGRPELAPQQILAVVVVLVVVVLVHDVGTPPHQSSSWLVAAAVFDERGVRKTVLGEVHPVKGYQDGNNTC